MPMIDWKETHCIFCEKEFTDEDRRKDGIQHFAFGGHGHRRCARDRFEQREVQAALPLLDGVEAGQEERAS